MYIRFLAALVCIVATSLFSVSLQMGNQRLREHVQTQRTRLATLEQDVAAARQTTRQLGAPRQLLDRIEAVPVAIESNLSSLR